MNDARTTTSGLDQTEDAILTNEISDEALEAAASIRGKAAASEAGTCWVGDCPW
jgi:hypothetical protein